LPLSALEGDLGRFDAEGAEIEADVEVEIELLVAEAELLMLDKLIAEDCVRLNGGRWLPLS
jgi:hypothetical protein